MLADALDLFVNYQDVYLKGLWIAVEAAAISLVLSSIIGLAGGITRYLSRGIAGRVIAAYVSLVRNTPLLIQIYFVFFGLPSLGITFDAFTTGVVALSFNSGAYITEIVRGGLAALPRGQTEAANALGMSKTALIVGILLPQAGPIILPAITGQFVQLIKDTSLLYTVAVLEITKAGDQVANETYKFLEAYLVSCIIYIIVCMTLNVIVDYYEARAGFSKFQRAA